MQFVKNTMKCEEKIQFIFYKYKPLLIFGLALPTLTRLRQSRRQLMIYRWAMDGRNLIKFAKMESSKLKQLNQIVYGKKSKSGKNMTKILSSLPQQENQPRELPIAVFLLSGMFNFQSLSEIKKFCVSLYKQVNYATNLLDEPTEALLAKKKVKLAPTSKKILLLDLDQTLIHSGPQLLNAQYQLQTPTGILRVSLRPHLLVFLAHLRALYDIYIFTCSTESHALPIIRLLNRLTNSIRGLLHRHHCLHTHNGFYIKDLRIIHNIDLSRTVIVDNKVHSFASQLDNGIPVQSYEGQHVDEVLVGLGQVLEQLAGEGDVREWLRGRLGLAGVIGLGCEGLLGLVGEGYRRRDRQ